MSAERTSYPSPGTNNVAGTPVEDRAGAPKQPSGQQPVQISCSRGFSTWLQRNQVSLAFTSYQTGRLYLVGVNPQEQTAFHERYLARAMGLWAEPQRLVVSTLFQVWRFEDVLGGNAAPGMPDRHYVPRVAHTTSDLDIHDIGVMADGRIVFVNTLFSCLSTLSPTHAFRVHWKPPFISKLAAEDRCHLNGLAMKDGLPAYVTATSRSDVVNGWRARRAEGGTLIDVQTDRIVTDQLSMPHSPRWYAGRIWLLNAGTGHLGFIDRDTGDFQPVAFCPGFLRGLAFHNGHAIVGLSLPRDGTFTGLALDDELKKRDADPWCGVQIVNLTSGDIVEWIKLEGGVSELFDVAVLPGVRWPVATGFLNDEINSLFTYEV
jgi:uncharacterized protein (TIGR03032 family)